MCPGPKPQGTTPHAKPACQTAWASHYTPHSFRLLLYYQTSRHMQLTFDRKNTMGTSHLPRDKRYTQQTHKAPPTPHYENTRNRRYVLHTPAMALNHRAGRIKQEVPQTTSCIYSCTSIYGCEYRNIASEYCGQTRRGGRTHTSSTHEQILADRGGGGYYSTIRRRLTDTTRS